MIDLSLIDILIIVFILVGGVVGFRQGFTRSLVRFLGVIVVLVLSFLLKNPISELLMSVMPFFPFGGLIKGVTVLNIALYEVIAFSIVFSILMIILKILSITTNIFEKVLNFTIILGIPSKILGIVVGVIKNYIIVFFVMYFLAMPNFSEVSIVNNSKFKEPILRNTPLLSNIAENSLTVLDEFKNLTEKYKDSTSSDEFNLDTLDLFLKYNITTLDNVKKLASNGKININGIERVISKYEK